MAYAIMRFEKHKATSIGSLAGSLAHTFRSRYTPNAKKELIKDNQVLHGPEGRQEVADAIRARWPEKRRKDAVGFIELFIGASPEWFKKHGGQGDQEAYFQRSIEWLKSYYGEANVISVVQHNDETSPHLAAYVVPIRADTGKLSAKHFADGPKGCAALQTSFHEAAGEPVGLERGQRYSSAEHMSIRRWYEEQANLDKRREKIEADKAELVSLLEEDSAAVDAREAEVERREQRATQQSAELAERRDALDRRAAELEARAQKAEAAASAATKRAEELAERRDALDKRAAELETRAKEAKAAASAAAEREKAVSERETKAATQAERLERLRVELEARGERLAGGEAALEQRQAEIDRAGQQLQERIKALKSVDDALEQKRGSIEGREEALQSRESALEAWAAKHEPEGVDALADAPRPLPAALRGMAGEAAADWHDAGLDKPAPKKGPQGPGM